MQVPDTITCERMVSRELEFARWYNSANVLRTNDLELKDWECIPDFVNIANLGEVLEQFTIKIPTTWKYGRPEFTRFVASALITHAKQLYGDTLFLGKWGDDTLWISKVVSRDIAFMGFCFRGEGNLLNVVVRYEAATLTGPLGKSPVNLDLVRDKVKEQLLGLYTPPNLIVRIFHFFWRVVCNIASLLVTILSGFLRGVNGRMFSAAIFGIVVFAIAAILALFCAATAFDEAILQPVRTTKVNFEHYWNTAPSILYIDPYGWRGKSSASLLHSSREHRSFVERMLTIIQQIRSIAE